MTRSKNGKTQATPPDADLLAELFDGDEYDPRERYDAIASLELGGLIGAVTGLGGMVAFYSVGTDNTLSFTVSFGERKRRYSLICDDSCADFLASITNTYKQAWVRRNPGTLASLQPTPKGK